MSFLSLFLIFPIQYNLFPRSGHFNLGKNVAWAVTGMNTLLDWWYLLAIHNKTHRVSNLYLSEMLKTSCVIVHIIVIIFHVEPTVKSNNYIYLLFGRIIRYNSGSTLRLANRRNQFPSYSLAEHSVLSFFGKNCYDILLKTLEFFWNVSFSADIIQNSIHNHISK